MTADADPFFKKHANPHSRAKPGNPGAGATGSLPGQDFSRPARRARAEAGFRGCPRRRIRVQLPASMNKRIPAFAARLVPFVLAAAAVAQEPVLERHRLAFDFESGSVGAWSSYPPAQDTAYDPTIAVRVVEGNPTRALVRDVIPNTEHDYLFGIRRKTDLRVTAESVLAFRAAVKDYRPGATLRVKLGFADGTSWETSLGEMKNLEWRDVRVPLGEALAGSPGKTLAAFAVLADAPRADPETKLRLAVDDVTLDGLREAHVRIVEPESHRLEEFGVSAAGVSYVEGDAVRIRVAFPGAAKYATVRLAPAFFGDGKPGPGADMKRAADGTYAAEFRGTSVRPGLWEARIAAFDGSGRAFGSRLVFLVRSASAPLRARPSLLLRRDALDRLRTDIAGPKRALWEKLKEEAAGLRAKYDPAVFDYNLDAYDEVYWLPTYTGYSSTIRGLASFARANALIYAVGGDREAGDAARRALLKMAEWPTYVHPHILGQGQFTYWPVGLTVLDLALAYDWTRELLEPGERRLVAEALRTRGFLGIYQEYVRDNRVSSNTSNWISHVAAGGILAALAAAEDLPPGALEPALTGLILKVRDFIAAAFDRDGDYGEGYAYHNFTMQTLCELLPVLADHFGLPVPDVVARSAAYLPYQFDRKRKEILDFGDTTSHVASFSNFAFLLGPGGDPRLKGLYDLAPGTRDVDLLLVDPGLRGRGPEGLPLVRLFRDTGTAIFRSGWGDEDFLFVFRCGPFFNHQHFDQGSFFLADRGDVFVTETGKSDYYNDPWYQKLVIQAGGHNAPLADGDVESQKAGDLLADVPAWREAARITDFLPFEDGAFVSGDLTPLYSGRFETLRRSVLYLAPRTIVLIDRAAGSNAARTLDLRFHAPLKADIVTGADGTGIRRPGGTLLVRTISPGEIRSAVSKRPLTLAEFGAENPVTMRARGFLQQTAPLGPDGVTIVNVLTTDESAVTAERETGPDGAIRLSAGGRSVVIPAGAPTLPRADGAKTEAVAVVSSPAGTAALRMTELAANGEFLARASSPVSLAITGNRASRTLVGFSADEDADLEIRAARRPAEVRIDGRPIGDWTWGEGRLKIRLRAGTGELSF